MRAVELPDNGRNARTLYVGGGTPSLFTIEQMGRLVNGLRNVMALENVEEFTIEVNPDDVTRDYVAGLVSLGVNRISMGMQSFNDAELAAIGRRHTSQQAIDAVKAIRVGGIGNVSIDLIYGLPSQTLHTWQASVEQAIELHPEHISAYALSYEPGTALWHQRERGEVCETDEDVSVAMYRLLIDSLREAGYEHYEISNFAKPGYESRHNLKYWNLDDYAGFGPGAHSYMTDETTGQGQRYYHLPDLEAYLKEPSKVEMMEPNGYADDMTEFTITALRLARGIDKIEFCERFGQDFWEFYGDLAHLQFKSFMDTGHAWESEEGIGLTLKGFNVSNQILSIFV